MKQPPYVVVVKRKSAFGHGPRRIGKRVKIPCGSAAVTSDESPMKPLRKGAVRRGD